MGLFESLKKSAPGLVTVASAEEWLKTKHPILNRTRPAVESSPDLTRILALPRRPPVDLESSIRSQALVELMTSRLRLPDRKCRCAQLNRPCITSLRPAQAWALYEAPLVGGLLAPIGVGHGKTGLDILMPLVMPDCREAVLLIPPGLKDQLWRDYQAWREHFRVPTLVLEQRTELVTGAPVLRVIPYSLFSRHQSTDLLNRIKPDLVIADEGHKLRHRQTATTARVLRYLSQNKTTRFCVWSGTLTARSIKDYAHLSALALKGGSPLPIDPNVVEEWSLAIDPSDWPAPMGALHSFCEHEEDVHKGFYRRLVQTPGVVATKEGAVNASIVIVKREAPPVPESVKTLLEQLRGTWTRPDGEELVDAMQVEANAKQLACGFYYHWRFPRGEPESQILDWFDKRKQWSRELREKLKFRREHLDSPLLCFNAARRAYEGYEGDLPVWRAATWPDWIGVKDEVEHTTEAVWIDEFLAHDAAAWGLSNKAVIWYEHSAFGERVSALSGLPLYAGGKNDAEAIAKETGDRSIICSIKAHGTGRDGLQRIFHQQLVTSCLSSGAQWEQLLGRLHRIGQQADEVTTYIYLHTEEMSDCLDKAIREARYIQETMGTEQKLLLASLTIN